MTRSAYILSCGAYLPEKILTNADLEKMVDTSDEWITQRTGIKQRHIAAEGENTSDLAIKAAKAALKNAGISGERIDAVILATTTPDQTFPATAVKVQAALDMKGGFAFDIQAACSGFVYALSIANNFIRQGQANRIMVIGAETFTRLVNWEDRTTCVLFGDGAGAVILEASDTKEGILSTHLHSDGKFRNLLYTDGGPSSTGTVGKTVMNGKEVFRHAVTMLSTVMKEALNANNLTAQDIDWFIPHQANQRIIESTARKLKLKKDQLITTVALHGNTSAASIPLALNHAVEDGRVQRDHLLLFEAMGAGLTWGAALVRW